MAQIAVIGAGYRFLYVSRFGYLRSALPKQATARLQAAAYQQRISQRPQHVPELLAAVTGRGHREQHVLFARTS